MERLKKFNDIHGTVPGNVTDELAAKEAEFAEAEVEAANGEEGCAQVEEPDAAADQEEEKDEVYSQYL